MRLDNRSRIVDGKQSDRPLFRAWIIGLLLIPVNCYWIIQMEEVRRAAGATVFSLFFNSIFTLWVLFSFNQVRDRFKRKSDGTSSLFSLDTKELLTIYIMVKSSLFLRYVTNPIAGCDLRLLGGNTGK